MATIDLGKIKPVWKGDWAGSTAYEKNDMVLEGVNSYICTTAHTSSGTFSSDTANWDIMAYGAELPAQSGNAGKSLVTDGTSLSWGTSFNELTDVGLWFDTAGAEGPAGPSSTGVSERYGSIPSYAAMNIRQTSNGNQVITIQETGVYFIKCCGASGGGLGGFGGTAWGTVNLSANDVLYIRVGQAGNTGQGTSSTTPIDPESTNFSNAQSNDTSYGGFGDGFGGQSSMWSGSGGGATAVRLNTDAIANRIIVAGGGGGGYWESTFSGTQSNSVKGGDGGGTVGTRSEGSGNNQSDYANGGTQSNGGSSGPNAGGTGTQSQGGNAYTSNDSGGGGGGYWGGAGGADNCPGGGGSGYVGGMNTSNRGMAIGGNHGHGYVYIRKVG
jgi:hypothetical protein